MHNNNYVFVMLANHSLSVVCLSTTAVCSPARPTMRNEEGFKM